MSLITNLAVVTMVFDQDIPVILRSMGAAVNVVVTNIMACLVYRRTKFAQVRENELSMELETRRQTEALAFAPAPTSAGSAYRLQARCNGVDCVKNATVTDLESISSVVEGGSITTSHSVICGLEKEGDN